MVKKIKGLEIQEILNCETAFIDFSAQWCGPCKMLAPVLDEVSENFDNVKFFNIDVDENPEAAKQFKIVSIPALFIVKKGEIAAQQVGFLPKDALTEFIKKNI